MHSGVMNIWNTEFLELQSWSLVNITQNALLVVFNALDQKPLTAVLKVSLDRLRCNSMQITELYVNCLVAHVFKW